MRGHQNIGELVEESFMKNQNVANANVQHLAYEQQASFPELFHGRAEKVVKYVANKFNFHMGRFRSPETSPVSLLHHKNSHAVNHSMTVSESSSVNAQKNESQSATVIISFVVDFAFNETEISYGYHECLRHVAVYLNDNNAVIAIVEGHSVNACPRSVENIAQLRAQTVADYLIERLSVSRQQLKVECCAGLPVMRHGSHVIGRNESKQINFRLQYPHCT